MEHPHDTFRYGPEDVAWFQQFTLEPVDPEMVRRRAAGGETLRTTDIPDHLGRTLAADVDTGPALYRLVQLFGTPNVPGLEAGADQPDREATTWQYLFGVTYTPGEADPTIPVPAEETEYRLSVYDYRTNLSVGLSRWSDPVQETDPDGDVGRVAAEPTGEAVPGEDLPDEEFLVALVQLVLSAVEHPVEATYGELWI